LKLEFERGMGKIPIRPVKRQYEQLKHSKMAKSPEEIAAYCFRCQGKKLMEHIGHVILKNGRAAARGVCSSCGTKMSIIEKTKLICNQTALTAEPPDKLTIMDVRETFERGKINRS